MNPKEAFLMKTLSNSSFPFRQMQNRQDVAPFLPILLSGDGCQGFTGPDPSTFLNENATILKNVYTSTNKKALLSYIQKGCV
ncbi:hypothetical protein SAMN06265219_10438 [Gracilimonas mengyeensis]|uniref:Uncharacterized protein n=1 Tax=Gracilimonas mengyeensis TaxID=1302730 RepID=A0A521C033_9BACT|nr:hypothetical protein SAMN06265219_10438 [Gracilimonas mengyeensis]